MKSSTSHRLAAAALLLLAVAAVAGATAAWLLRFDLDRVVFGRTPAPASSDGFSDTLTLPGRDGAAMLVRRFDRALVAPRQGCVVWFPGRHGGFDPETRALFLTLQKAGLAVHAVAYPGQDGAPGRARFADVQALSAAAVSSVAAACGRTRTVVAGHSLGAMVAAYAAGAAPAAGLVMTSAAPTLSAGIRGTLRDTWALRPLALLPIERLVPHEFSLAEAIPPWLHAVVFQGGADTRTPLADLAGEAEEPQHLSIVVVAGGNHRDTPLRASGAMISAMLGMMRGSDEAVAAQAKDE